LYDATISKLVDADVDAEPLSSVLSEGISGLGGNDTAVAIF
jgi:hypothetical protein